MLAALINFGFDLPTLSFVAAAFAPGFALMIAASFDRRQRRKAVKAPQASEADAADDADAADKADSADDADAADDANGSDHSDDADSCRAASIFADPRVNGLHSCDDSSHARGGAGREV